MDLPLLLTLCFSLAALAWLGIVATSTVGLLHMPKLPGFSPGANRPRISVILAGRDEQDRIGQTVRRALAQRGVDLEVIVADDRSADATPDILAALAAEDARVRVVRIDALPGGWLGKCHALHRASALATGEWLLFIDADTWLSDTVVSRAVALAQRQRARHLCLAPSIASTTLPGRATLLAGMTLLGSRAFTLNLDLPTGYMGVGAFNMIDAALYREIGGHEPLRMEIVDDVKLGLLARKAGARSRLALAPREVEVEWAGSARAFLALLRKNAFATQNLSTPRAALVTLLGLGCLLAPLAAPVALGASDAPSLRAAALACLLACAASVIPAGILSARFGWGVMGVALSPLAYWVLLAAGVNSTIHTLRAGGVRWRDTFYPLADLRRGIVR